MVEGEVLKRGRRRSGDDKLLNARVIRSYYCEINGERMLCCNYESYDVKHCPRMSPRQSMNNEKTVKTLLNTLQTLSKRGVTFSFGSFYAFF